MFIDFARFRWSPGISKSWLCISGHLENAAQQAYLPALSFPPFPQAPRAPCVNHCALCVICAPRAFQSSSSGDTSSTPDAFIHTLHNPFKKHRGRMKAIRGWRR